MSEGSRPEFIASEQQLDGSYRPVEEPPTEEPPAEAPEAAASRRWPGRRRWWAAGAGALVLVAGGVGWWVQAASGEDEPARFTSMPEPCSLVPGETLEQYVPRSDPPVPNEAENSADERYAACSWAERPGLAGVQASRRIDVSVRLHLDGTASAKSEYDAAWNSARTMEGTSTDAPGSLRAEAPTLIRVGDQAFAQNLTLTGPLGRSGTAAATVRLRNAVITVRFRATVSPDAKDASPKTREAPPVDKASARAAAEAAARSATSALAACRTCLSR
ncbi:hypothetical protein SAMN05443665_102186 [Actinomadura meyerae]|uniref:Uncharacterized protein n=1 Tax=Actinomadura meyerae TaxID=240840 RepID=A0A239LAZ6_9ACTN|nr:hypothetical protein [Actinomadura meyerae]SNT26724.1 hypothetical protein SAMN05443665_102186 [Actinomadura meyerae]